MKFYTQNGGRGNGVSGRRLPLIQEPFLKIAVGLDAAVAEEGPIAADFFDPTQVAVGHQNFLPVGGRFGGHLTEGVRDERAPPELQRVLATGAVDGRDIAAVGDGVPPLDRFPRAVLGGALGVLFLLHPPDRRRIKENLRARERGQPGGLRVPLVPADEDADFPVPGVPGPVPEVPRREVEFLMIIRIVRNMHLAVFPQIRPVGVDHHGGVVVDPGGSFFEEGGDNHTVVLAGGGGQPFGRGPRHRFGEGEPSGVLILAEIRREEQLLEANNLRAAAGRLGDAFEGTLKIFLPDGTATRLNQTDLYVHRG